MQRCLAATRLRLRFYWKYSNCISRAMLLQLFFNHVIDVAGLDFGRQNLKLANSPTELALKIRIFHADAPIYWHFRC